MEVSCDYITLNSSVLQIMARTAINRTIHLRQCTCARRTSQTMSRNSLLSVPTVQADISSRYPRGRCLVQHSRLLVEPNSPEHRPRRTLMRAIVTVRLGRVDPVSHSSAAVHKCLHSVICTWLKSSYSGESGIDISLSPTGR